MKSRLFKTRTETKAHGKMTLTNLKRLKQVTVKSKRNTTVKGTKILHKVVSMRMKRILISKVATI